MNDPLHSLVILTRWTITKGVLDDGQDNYEQQLTGDSKEDTDDTHDDIAGY